MLGEAAAPTSVKNVESPAAIGPAFVAVTTWPALPTVQPVPVPLTNASPAGSVSRTVIVPEVAWPPTLITLRR